MCSAPRPSAPKAPKIPPLPDPPPPPPVPVLLNGRPYAGVIRKTAVQKKAKHLASRGPSQLLIRRPKGL
jgi:hypothetical protein